MRDVASTISKKQSFAPYLRTVVLNARSVHPDIGAIIIFDGISLFPILIIYLDYSDLEKTITAINDDDFISVIGAFIVVIRTYEV